MQVKQTLRLYNQFGQGTAHALYIGDIGKKTRNANAWPSAKHQKPGMKKLNRVYFKFTMIVSRK